MDYFFTGTPTSRHRPLPFVDAFPLSVWIHLKMPGIKDGVPLVPGAEDDYSPATQDPPSHLLAGVPSSQDNTSGAHTDTSSADDADNMAEMSSTERSVRQASDRVKREKSIGKKEAALNVLVHCHSLVSCQLNHFQYLFLMRQLDMLTEMSAFVTNDTFLIYQTAGEKNSWIRAIEDSLVVSAIVPQVDVSFVIPPLHPTKDSMLGDMEGFVPDSSSTVGDVQEIDSLREMRASTSDHSINQRLQGAAMLSQTPGATVPGLTSAMQFEASNISSDLSKSHSDGQLAAANGFHINSNNVHSKGVPPVKSSHPLLPSVNLVSPTSGGGTVITPPHHSNVPANSIQDNLNIGFSSMKKGFSNFMTSFETPSRTSPEDMSDTISIQSDLSSDSENFVLLNIETNHFGGAERSDSGLGMEAAFRAGSKLLEASTIELASEAMEETTPSEEVSEMTSSFKRKINVRLAMFSDKLIFICPWPCGKQIIVKWYFVAVIIDWQESF